MVRPTRISGRLSQQQRFPGVGWWFGSRHTVIRPTQTRQEVVRLTLTLKHGPRGAELKVSRGLRNFSALSIEWV
jgi:hypothetical protein